MGKKRVVKRVKKPDPKKDGAVAKRAVKKPLLLESRKRKPRVAVPLTGPIKPCRIKRLGSRQRKKDADKRLRRRLESQRKFYDPDLDLLNDDELAVELGLGDDANDVVEKVNRHQVGDSAFEN